MRKALQRNWFHIQYWKGISEDNISNKQKTKLKIYQTIDALISGKFFNQRCFSPFKSFKWWILWISNKTELDAFGEFVRKNN